MRPPSAALFVCWSLLGCLVGTGVPIAVRGADPDPPQPNASQPNASQPNASQPNASQPNASQPDPPQPNAAQPDPPQPSVFDLPQLQSGFQQLQRELRQLFDERKYADAEQRCQAALKLAPDDAGTWYNLACAQARQNRPDDALTSLAEAVKRGFRDANQLKSDDDLAAVRESDRFKEIVKLAEGPPPEAAPPATRTIQPVRPVDGVVLVGNANTVWDPRRGLFLSLFDFSQPLPADVPPAKGLGATGDLLRKWWEEGTAAGNYGDVYDNHDSDHSNMNYDAFPQLARIEFDEEAQKRNLHHGLQNRFLYNAVTLGNSSTAIVGGPIWRSQPRLALTNPQATLSLLAQYASNHLYVYPEHRDHDPGHNGREGQGHGDVYPVNTPYLLISQGSSGSDRPFLSALAATLAAFRPDVKKALAAQGAIAPTLQMLLRRSYKPVTNDQDYLTGKAHPTVFDGGQLDTERMVTLAHDLTVDTLPPLVRLRVIEEDQPQWGRDYFHPQPVGERLFDTPSAIARVGRGVQFQRRMVVSAEQSVDPSGHPLTYHWVVLRGDPRRIEITPRNEQQSVAEIKVQYHPRRPIAADHELESNRVDIGVFVHNGHSYSAPAFVTYVFPDNERREYDDQHRIAVVDYADAEVGKNYIDPLLDTRKTWRDEYHYDATSGELLGWTRIQGPQRHEFTADGLLVENRDSEGRPLETRRVRYVVKTARGAAPELTYEPLVENE